MAYKTHVFPRDHIRGDFAHLVKDRVWWSDASLRAHRIQAV